MNVVSTAAPAPRPYKRGDCPTAADRALPIIDLEVISGHINSQRVPPVLSVSASSFGRVVWDVGMDNALLFAY